MYPGLRGENEYSQVTIGKNNGLHILSIHGPERIPAKPLPETRPQPGNTGHHLSTMKTIIYMAITATTVGLLTGCETTGMSPHEHSGVDYPNYVLNLRPDSTGPRARLNPPIHLAVAQIGESAPPSAMLDALSSRPDLIASVIGVPLPGNGQAYSYGYNKQTPAIDYASRIQAVCRLAKESGADHVFLFGGDIDSWSEQNPLAILDLTIIGGMIFPGTKIELEGKTAGVLIDASTRQSVFLVNADDKISALSPDCFANDRTMGLRVQARDDLVKKLQGAFLTRLAAQIQ